MFAFAHRHPRSSGSEPSVEASECVCKHHSHQQAACPRNQNVTRLAQLKLSHTAYKQIANGKIERAPKHIHQRGREPLPWRRSKRALKGVPCDAAHKMRDRICKKSAAKKV